MTTELTVARQRSRTDHTIGELLWDGVHECWTCEDVIREIEGQAVALWKIQNLTAIPAGRYRVVIDFSPHFNRELPHVLNVPGFDGIRIHIGNFAKDTDGCLLVGTGVTNMGVSGSTIAFAAFFPKLQNALKSGDVWITYVNPPVAIT